MPSTERAMIEEQHERYINPYTDFGFKKLFEQAEIAKYSVEERRQYEASQKEYWDYTSTLETAELKGEKKGEIIGEKKGLIKGEKKKAIDVAQKMKADGLPVETIAKYTELSPEQIEKL
jgi:predicted transposase/invertase (TIGR01784 family)